MAKYKLGEGLWFPDLSLNNKMSALWTDIIEIHLRQPHMFAKYMENVKINVGDGKNILFWKDNWLNESCLAVAFPTIFRLITNKEESLNEVLSRKEDIMHWEFQFRRRLYQWEEEALLAL